MQPDGQLGEVGGLGGLAGEHVVVELLAPGGQLVATLLEGVVDPDHVGQQLTLLPEVAPEHPVGQSTEHADRPAPHPTAGIGRIEGVGQRPVAVEVPEGRRRP